MSDTRRRPGGPAAWPRLWMAPRLAAIGLFGGLVLMGSRVGASECPARIGDARAGIEAKAQLSKRKPPSRRRDRLLKKAQDLLVEAETLHTQGNHADAVARAKEALGIVQIDLHSG